MPSLLVVDDSSVDRRLVESLIERQGGLDWLVEYAENGVQALAQMRDLLPDVVVTDLQMPEMDGLALVSAIGASYPDVPVILMTGQGSESIAIEALDKGAASYVPKERLAEKLMSTISQIMSRSKTKLGHKRVSRCITDAQLKLQLANDLTLIAPLANYFQDMLNDMQFCDQSDRVHIAIAIEESLSNAICHGNLELPADEVRKSRSNPNQKEFLSYTEKRAAQSPYCERKVFVEAYSGPSEVRFVIRDEGPGFSKDSIPEKGDPTILEQFEGRGLVLMRNFMDEVTYNQTGNEVTLVKRRTNTEET